MFRYGLLLAAAGLTQSLCAQERPPVPASESTSKAASQSSDRFADRFAYKPPNGFGRYSWNTSLSEFQRLVPDPVYVRIAYSRGVVREFDLDCFLDGSSTFECSELDGIGHHALAEYYVDSQGFRLVDDKAKTVLFPITYQFCAHWDGFSSNVAGDMTKLMQLCGVRLHFRGESAQEEQVLRDSDQATSSQRVLNWLIDTYGEPDNFERRGSVTVVGVETERASKARRKNRYDNWYWCSPKVDDVTPKCDSSIVFTFDSETARGQVIFLTPPVWMYAHARRYGGAEDDPLYRLLNGGQEPPPVRHICTGSFICEPPPPKPMPEKMLARFRAPVPATPSKTE